MSLDLDLARWEAGEISSEELERLHPHAAIASLVAVHERLSAITEEPVSGTEAAMERMLAQLPDRARRAPRHGSRVLLLAATAVLLTASMAVAMPGVRSSVSGLAHSVGHLFGDDAVAPPSPAPAIIDRGHPGSPGEARGADDGEDTQGSHESGSGGRDEPNGDTSEVPGGSGDEQGGSSESSGGDSSGDGAASSEQGSDSQGSDNQGSDGESTGGDGQGTDSQTTDSQTTDSQTTDSQATDGHGSDGQSEER